MNCDDVEALLGAYALDALSDRDRREVEAHLAACDRHPEAAGLRAAGIGLAWLAEEREPSGTLEVRILESITDLIASGAPLQAPVVTRAPAASRVGRRRAWLGAVAAAVVVGALGFAGGLAVGRSDGGTPALVHVYRSDGASMRVSDRGDARVQVTMSGLEQRGFGEAYQLWAVRGQDDWISVGICNTDEDGWWDGDFAFAVEPSDVFVLTVEPAGGSSTPTGARVLGSVR